MKNNLGFGGGIDVTEVNAAASDGSPNYFTLPITVDDFLGLDEADLVKPRQPGGDLHDLPIQASAPDLGAFESP